MREHWLFVWNVLSHLVASMSGVASFIMATVEHARQKKIESRMFFIVGVICLIVAFDQAWQDEHRNSQVLIVEKSAIYSERDFWKQQNYEKDAALRSRDQLLGQNFTALTETQKSASATQSSLAELSNKILDLNSQKQRFTARRIDQFLEGVLVNKHYSLFLVMTNLPAYEDIIVKCEQSFQIIDAQIIEGGPRFPNIITRLSPDQWRVKIPSPQVTNVHPLIITAGYDVDSPGACSVEFR